MTYLKDTLIAGTGPVAVQMAVLVAPASRSVAIAGRPSTRSAQFLAAIQNAGGIVGVEVQNPAHRAVAGHCRLKTCFGRFEDVSGTWSTLVLAVSTDAYVAVIDSLDPQVLAALESIVLVSPTLGSAVLVREAARRRGASDVVVISFSSYLADTRWPDRRPGPIALTAGVKRRISIASTAGPSPCAGTRATDAISAIHEKAGVAVSRPHLPIEAEARNLSLYVHPALFMNDVALGEVFAASTGSAEDSDTRPPRYVYKLFPEGPITPSLVRNLVSQWRELNQLISRLGGRGVNLLQFMLEDGYPVRPESISADDIARFQHVPEIHQEYLIYIRYASLLIDPFSQPDDQGRYFDFSGIAIPSMYREESGAWQIPRMPREDYYRTKIIQGIARHLQTPCPTIDHLLTTYETALVRARRNSTGPWSDAFTVQDFDADLELITSALPGGDGR